MPSGGCEITHETHNVFFNITVKQSPTFQGDLKCFPALSMLISLLVFPLIIYQQTNDPTFETVELDLLEASITQ